MKSIKCPYCDGYMEDDNDIFVWVCRNCIEVNKCPDCYEGMGGPVMGCVCKTCDGEGVIDPSSKTLAMRIEEASERAGSNGLIFKERE